MTVIVWCLVVIGALTLAAASLPPYLRSVRGWYDTFDALAERDPERAAEWYDHMPLRVRLARRWVETQQ